MFCIITFGVLRTLPSPCIQRRLSNECPSAPRRLAAHTHSSASSCSSVLRCELNKHYLYISISLESSRMIFFWTHISETISWAPPPPLRCALRCALKCALRCALRCALYAGLSAVAVVAADTVFSWNIGLLCTIIQHLLLLLLLVADKISPLTVVPSGKSSLG